MREAALRRCGAERLAGANALHVNQRPNPRCSACGPLIVSWPAWIAPPLLVIDVAGHPHDQQVGIELLRARLGQRPGGAPLTDRLHDRLEVEAGGREAILEGAASGACPARDDLGPLERAHAVGEDRA
jgi:hypothetical protein